MTRPYALISLALSIVIGLALVSILDDITNPTLRSNVKPAIYKLAGISALTSSLKQYIPTSYLRLYPLRAGLPAYYQHSSGYNATNVNREKLKAGTISTRQLEEKSRLRDRMKRDNNKKWDSSHPRYRLLTAMHGFARYKDRNLAEADRWSTLYLNSPMRHRKVSLVLPLFTLTV